MGESWVIIVWLAIDQIFLGLYRSIILWVYVEWLTLNTHFQYIGAWHESMPVINKHVVFCELYSVTCKWTKMFMNKIHLV